MWQQQKNLIYKEIMKPFGGLVLGGELRQGGGTNADTKQVPHGQDWRWWCCSKARVKWGVCRSLSGLTAARLSWWEQARSLGEAFSLRLWKLYA